MNDEPKKEQKKEPPKPQQAELDWESKCDVCGASPVLVETGMCGPCSTGEADTALGNI